MSNNTRNSMPRGIPNKRMNNEQVKSATVVDEASEVSSGVVKQEEVEITSIAPVVTPIAPIIPTLEVPVHASNLHSFNWSIVPQGNETYEYTNNVTGFSFVGEMKDFNKILRGK